MKTLNKIITLLILVILILTQSAIAEAMISLGMPIGKAPLSGGKKAYIGDFADACVQSYTYDSNNNLTAYTNRRGQKIQYLYDAIGRRHQKIYPDASLVNYKYDELSRLKQIINSVTTLAFSYDNLNRKISETTLGKTTGYQYDLNNNLTQITYPDNTETITRAYDTLNRLTLIQNSKNQNIAKYTYSPLNMKTSVQYLNGLVTNYTYDSLSRLNTISNTLENISYTYNKASYLKTMTNPQGTHTYTYDATYQLTAVTGPYTQTLNYDSLGNRTTTTIEGAPSTYTANNMNQYQKINTQTRTHDPSGNLTNNGTHTFQYNYENRLTHVDDNITYSYDLMGRRRSKTVDGQTIKFLWSGYELAAEYSGTGSLLRSYISADRIDSQIAMETGGTKYYLHRDGLNSVTHITDETGALIEQYEYTPFGEPTIKNANGDIISESSIGNSLMFCGYYYDKETGLYYVRNRYYDPEAGRFLSTDPLGYWDSLNLYEYVHNNPVNWIDPYGLKVTNNTENTIYVKPESMPTAEPLGPGETYPGAQDGIANPTSNPGEVFKNVNDLDVTVGPSGEITTSGGGVIGSLGQSALGGWKDKSWQDHLNNKDNPDKGWNELFKKSKGKVVCK